LPNKAKPLIHPIPFVNTFALCRPRTLEWNNSTLLFDNPLDTFGWLLVVVESGDADEKHNFSLQFASSPCSDTVRTYTLYFKPLI